MRIEPKYFPALIATGMVVSAAWLLVETNKIDVAKDVSRVNAQIATAKVIDVNIVSPPEVPMDYADEDGAMKDIGFYGCTSEQAMKSIPSYDVALKDNFVPGGNDCGFFEIFGDQDIDQIAEAKEMSGPLDWAEGVSFGSIVVDKVTLKCGVTVYGSVDLTSDPHMAVKRMTAAQICAAYQQTAPPAEVATVAGKT